MVMKLSRLPLRRAAEILDVGGEQSFRRRLMEFGLVPGTPVEVTRIAPLGDPIQLLVRGCRLSIRRAEARQLTVDSRDLEEAGPAAGTP